MAGHHAERLAGLQVVGQHLAIQLDPGLGVARDLLQDEARAAEHARAQLALEPDADLYALSSAEKAGAVDEVALATRDADRQNRAGHLRGESNHARRVLRRVLGHEERAAADGAGERAEEALAAARIGGGVQLDTAGHPG